MTVNVEKSEGLLRLQIEGEMTIFTAEELMKRMFEDYAECSGMEMDLSQVTEMDTSGFQLLYMARKESLESDRTFRIISHSPAVMSVLETYNINKEDL